MPIKITVHYRKCGHPPPDNEIIVACINFAVMGRYGYFVNWIGVLPYRITEAIFGAPFHFETGGGTWKQKHLGTFLLEIAHLVSRIIIQTNHGLSDIYYVILQAIIDEKETAHRFYNQLGFAELGFLENDNELQTVFRQLPDVVESGKLSCTDFINFICHNNADINLEVLVNEGGVFTQNSTLRRGPPGGNIVLVYFPFSLRRKDFLALAEGLPCFFLPFENDLTWFEFIIPNVKYTNYNTVNLQTRDTLCLSGRDENAWINDTIVDFVQKWLVMDGTTMGSKNCSFVSCTEIQMLASDFVAASGESQFHNCIEAARRLHFCGCFDKEWICFPINQNGDHWSFVAVLNMTYLKSSQDEKFTAFLYYDSTNKEMTRGNCLRILHVKGILNLILCANVLFGLPSNQPIKEMDKLLKSSKRFSRIQVYDSEYPSQKDGSNCGVYLCLCMMDTALNLSHYFHRLVILTQFWIQLA